MLIQTMKWYSISRIYNSKVKVVFSTTSVEKLLKKIKKMELRYAKRSFIFSHVRMTSPNGSIYALREHLELHDGDITLEPYQLWELVKDF